MAKPGSPKRSPGDKFLTNYTNSDYDHYPQNWAVIQDSRGIIYVGNTAGVLEFDGVTWRVIYVPNWYARSLAIDETGRIYVGGFNEIGYLSPDEKRTLGYVSLVDHLDDKQKEFSHVRSTHATKTGVYFESEKYIFRWHEGKMKVWQANHKFIASFYCHGEFFVQEKGIGLLKMEGDSLQKIPGGGEFRDVEIFMLAPYDSAGKKLLIATRSKGMYTYDEGAVVPFPTEMDIYLKEKRLYQGIRLSSGDFALATLRGGLVIIDPGGKLKHLFDSAWGLQDDDVKNVFQDKSGNLWLPLMNGISRIEYASPFTIYSKQTGLSGTVLSVTKYRKTLYAGTSIGLFRLASTGKFLPIRGISEMCRYLLPAKNSLLAATEEGIFQIEGGQEKQENVLHKVIEHPTSFFLQSKKETNRIWAGTRRGLISLHLDKKKRRWELELEFKTIGEEICSIVETRDGSLWLGTLTKGVIKVDFPTGLDKPIVSRYYKEHGLPGSEVDVSMAAGHVMFATKKGIFRFDKEKKEFIPDKTFGDEFADGSRAVFRVVEGNNKCTWIFSKGRNIQAVIQPGGAVVLNRKPFLRIPVATVHSIYPDPGKKTVWFADNLNGLYCFDSTVEKNYNQEFTALIRKVKLINREFLIFDGYRVKKNKIINADNIYPIIKYEDRNIRFQFAAPFFEDEAATGFQVLLEGYDEDWSKWSPETQKDYTNLDARDYIFRVRAKNVYGNISREDTFDFKVLPPWFQTWWAYSIYTLAGIFLVFFIVRWYSGRLRREKEKLELVVKERTKEIGEKNIQLEGQTTQLKEQSEKLKEMDTMKSRFFANISHEFRTPLTLILGPLEQMIDACPENEAERKRKLTLIFRNAQRLLRLINQLLELSKLDSGRMKLHACETDIITFIKGIVDSFRVLTQQKELELVFSGEPGENETAEEIDLYIDPRKMEDIMSNLLVNAVKFTPPGGQVRVTVKQHPPGSDFDSVPYPETENNNQKFFGGSRGAAFQKSPPGRRRQEGFVEISVCDTGPGIPGEQLGFVFDRFYQADSTFEFHEKGTGIGLALCKELVELHHGVIEAANREEGGSRFTVRLPVGSAHLAAGEIVEPGEARSIASGGEGGFFEKLPPSTPQKTFDNFTSAASDRETKEIILVVEDSAEMRDYIRGELEPAYTVIEAEDGRRGIEKARETIPDLIISDVMMPEVDGYELCRTLKTGVETSHIPVILLTAKASDESVVTGLETGADDYVTKPFKTKILLARIKNLIDIRAQLQKNINREMTLQPVKTTVSKLDREFLKNLNDVINKNLADEDFNVEKLSKKLYMGRTSLYRKVLALTGFTPTEFIRTYRLKRGAELLKQGSISVLEVAFEVGFSDSSYFSKCFKEKFHQLPSDYRGSEQE
ncbi:MAG: response regulator [Candidatus Aminicenantes bacterium]|nr:response regulator [Candidatus Aminicenantes bacterium]